MIILYFGTYYYYLSFVWCSLHFLDFGDYFLDFTISYLMLGTFSSIIFSNIYSDPFFSFGTSVIQMLVHVILSQRSLKLSSFLFIFFLSSPYQLFPVIYLLVDLFILLLQLFCFWFLLVYFSNQLLYYLALFVCSLAFLCPWTLNISCIFLIHDYSISEI